MNPTNLEPQLAPIDSASAPDFPSGDESALQPPADAPPIRPFTLDDLAAPETPLRAARSPDDLALRIEFGTAQLNRSDVQQLVKGAVVQLDELADAPVRILVEDHLVALGELVTRENKLCVCILKLVPTPHSEAA